VEKERRRRLEWEKEREKRGMWEKEREEVPWAPRTERMGCVTA
jgi:hypothetical protein